MFRSNDTAGKTAQADGYETAVARALPLLKTLGALHQSLVVLQAASLMALEGAARATASAIAERASEDSFFRVTPSIAGQILAALKVRRVTTRGRNFIVLEPEPLSSLHQTLAARVEEMAPKIEVAHAAFAGVMERVEALEDQLQTAYGMVLSARQLQEALNSCRGVEHRVRRLEREYTSIKQEAAREQRLQSAIEELQAKLGKGEELERRREDLERTVEVQTAREADLQRTANRLARQEQDLDRREAELGSRDRGLRQRLAALDLEDLEAKARERKKQLDEEIHERKRKLDEVLRQLGEKRPLLARMFGKVAEDKP